MNITPVILSGGSGTRLWPMSTPDHPKQFLPLTSEDTMFQQTLARVGDPRRFAAPLIVANGRHQALIEAQLGGRDATLLLEPAARNTAPAIALAALAAPHALLLVMPSDHVITNPAAFQNAIDAAVPHADAGWLVTFGISPDAPETGYGYIQLGDALAAGVHQVARFVEKPDAARAAEMLATGDHVWNGGIFLFRADAYLAALADHAPEMLAAVTKAMNTATRTTTTTIAARNSRKVRNRPRGGPGGGTPLSVPADQKLNGDPILELHPTKTLPHTMPVLERLRYDTPTCSNVP